MHGVDLSFIINSEAEHLPSSESSGRLQSTAQSLPVLIFHLLLIYFSFTLVSPYSVNMAHCSLSSSRLILYSADALVLVSIKVQEASKFPDIKIVSFDWLMTSIKSHVRADETQFTFDQADPSPDKATSPKGHVPSQHNDTKGKGRKRPWTPTLIEEDPSDVEDFEEQAPAKKHKDVQIATSGSLLIPVDETCPLAGETHDRKPFSQGSHGN